MNIQKLSSLEINDVPKFSLEGMTFDAKVVKVYDGDTATVIFYFKDNYYKWNCRLEGIDTAEIKSKNTEQKEFAKSARDFLSERILNKIVMIQCNTFDKYGRLLITLIYDNVNVNQQMITEGYAKEYFGGKKE